MKLRILWFYKLYCNALALLFKWRTRVIIYTEPFVEYEQYS